MLKRTNNKSENDINIAFDKICKTIASSRTIGHLEVCEKMVELHKKQTQQSVSQLSLLIKKRKHVIDTYPVLEGDECMVVSNERNPVWKGVIKEFDDFDKINQDYLPIIIDCANGTEYLCMGIVLPYDKKLQDELNNMDYIDRWNSVCNPHCKIKNIYIEVYRNSRTFYVTYYEDRYQLTWKLEAAEHFDSIEAAKEEIKNNRLLELLIKDNYKIKSIKN
jgi:hypothetical protein